jgi:hypothetical protein
MKMAYGRLAKLGWTLCILSAICLTGILFLSWQDGGTAHDGRKALTFIRPRVIQAILVSAGGCTASLLVLLVYGLAKKAERIGQVAMALVLSVSLYPLALILAVVVGFAKSCSWEVEETIKGVDNRTYYILHAPPPLNGAGHSALARRTGGNSLYYTMNVISADYGSEHNAGVLTAGLKDPNPETRRICRMLLNTLKQREAAKQRKQ